MHIYKYLFEGPPSKMLILFFALSNSLLKNAHIEEECILLVVTSRTSCSEDMDVIGQYEMLQNGAR